MNISWNSCNSDLTSAGGPLANLEAATQIQFHMPEGGPRFAPGILQSLELATQIEFLLPTKGVESVATVVSIYPLTHIAARKAA